MFPKRTLLMGMASPKCLVHSEKNPLKWVINGGSPKWLVQNGYNHIPAMIHHAILWNQVRPFGRRWVGDYGGLASLAGRALGIANRKLHGKYGKMMDAKLALAIWGRAPVARLPPTPQKSFRLLVFRRFWGPRAGKKDAKIPRCVSEVHFGYFFAIFYRFFAACQARKNYNL